LQQVQQKRPWEPWEQKLKLPLVLPLLVLLLLLMLVDYYYYYLHHFFLDHRLERGELVLLLVLLDCCRC
jgi:hypothetical protein